MKWGALILIVGPALTAGALAAVMAAFAPDRFALPTLIGTTLALVVLGSLIAFVEWRDRRRLRR